MTRQQTRRIAFKARKAAALIDARNQAAVALAAMRRGRTAAMLPKRHPGLIVPTGRPYAKPHGQSNWRCKDLPVLLDGNPVPHGCEAVFHATKGLRVTRIARSA